MQTTEESETQVEVSSIVKPAVSLQELKDNYDEFEKVKKLLLKPEDYYNVKIQGRDVKALGKAGWYKLGVAFNLTTTIIQEVRTYDPETKITRYDITVKCIAPNGRSADEVGTCDNGPTDREKANEHVVRAMAKTRATERAYIVVLGVSERAAEDLESAGTTTPSETKDGTYREGLSCDCKSKGLQPQTKNDFKCHRCGGSVEH